MGLTDVAGIFSRYFVIGFFLPVFFVLVAVAQLLGSASLPAAYREASGGTQLAILGGTAALLALLLSGLHYHLIRTLEGYPIKRLEDLEPRGRIKGVLHRLPARMTKRWKDAFEEKTKMLEGEQSPERTRAARELNRYFPWRVEILLPTRLGNTIRAFETHPNKCYGLDGVTAWPGIEVLLTENERETLTEARTDFAFFVNLTVLPWLGGLYLFVDLLVHPAGSHIGTAALLAAVVVASLALSQAFYRAAVGAAVRWGMPVKASFDMHRLELYSQLGLRRPRNEREERTIAKAATRCMLYGEPFEGMLRDQSAPGGGK